MNRHIVSFCLTVILPVWTSVSYPQNPNREPGLADSEQREGITVIKMTPLVVLRAEVNSKPINVIFDTGASPSILDARLKPFIQGKLHTTNSGVSKCSAMNLKLGPWQSSLAQSMNIYELNRLDELLNVEIGGVVGSPFVFGRVVVLDFENRQFSLIDQSGIEYGTSGEIIFDQFYCPTIEIEICGVPRRFLIDTGFNGAVNLDMDTWNECQQQGLISDHQSVQVVVHEQQLQTRNLEMGFLRKLDFFGHELKDVPVTARQPGKIGIEILRRFDVLLDLKEGRIGLRRNSFFSDPFPRPAKKQPQVVDEKKTQTTKTTGKSTATVVQGKE